MVGLLLFVIFVLLQIFVMYRIGRIVFWGYSTRSLLEICINFLAAIVLTFILFIVIQSLSFFIYINNYFGLGMLLDKVGHPLAFVLVFILIFRLLKHGKQQFNE